MSGVIDQVAEKLSSLATAEGAAFGRVYLDESPDGKDYITLRLSSLTPRSVVEGSPLDSSEMTMDVVCWSFDIDSAWNLASKVSDEMIGSDRWSAVQVTASEVVGEVTPTKHVRGVEVIYRVIPN